jgi:hypothetical protein
MEPSDNKKAMCWRDMLHVQIQPTRAERVKVFNDLPDAGSGDLRRALVAEGVGIVEFLRLAKDDPLLNKQADRWVQQAKEILDNKKSIQDLNESRLALHKKIARLYRSDMSIREVEKEVVKLIGMYDNEKSM